LHKYFIKFGLKKFSGLHEKDTFNWSFYHIHYKGELKDGIKNHTLSLKTDDYLFENKSLIKNNNNILPLCENHRLLYETVMRLNPESIFELGCGNGIHLNNLQVLLPQSKLSGIDLLDKQIEFLWKTYPNLKAEIKQADATKPFDQALFPKVDLSFTQVVISHIHTEDAHKIALANLFNISNKYVILMEKWKNHNYFEDIKEIAEKGLIDWPHLFFYYRLSAETKKPHIMIVSREVLDYPEISDYSIFPNN
jgi:hypothetical protein